jgi:hypothetical protein
MGHHYDSSFGFTGSAGKGAVKGYMREGPKISEHKSSAGKGEYKAGGRVEHKAPDSKGEFAKGGWIKGALGGKHSKGALHRALHVPEGKKIPEKKLEKAEHSKSGKVRKEANLAKTLKKFKLGGVVTHGEYEVPRTASPIYKYAKGGAVKKMDGFPKMAGEYGVPPTSFKKYAKGGMATEGKPTGKIAKANDSNEKWADYKHGGMKHKRGGGRC